MKTKTVLCFATAFGVATLAGPDASAQRETGNPVSQFETRRVVRVSDQRTTTTISGNSAGHYTTLRAPRNYVLAGISFAERRDNPCYVKAIFTTARHGSGMEHWVDDATDDLCEYSSNDIEYINVGDTPATLEAIHAIQVGLNRARDKIKAVSISGSTIDQDDSGDVRRDAGLSDFFTRNNFKEPWKNKVSCEDGKVAVGLVLHYNRDPDHVYPSIEGIALECAPVSVHTYHYQPGTNDRLESLSGGR